MQEPTEPPLHVVQFSMEVSSQRNGNLLWVDLALFPDVNPQHRCEKSWGAEPGNEAKFTSSLQLKYTQEYS